ncbi:5736_t:CDS:1, partial [Scutellospora calospora]
EITNSTSSMSLEQKKQLLLEIRQKKMLLRNFLQNEGNLDLGKITKQNTDRNKEYRCEFDVVVVRKNIPKPPSPSTKLQKQKKKANATESRKKVNSNIPVLKQRSGKEIANINLEKKDENSVEKCVRWVLIFSRGDATRKTP